MQSGCTCMWRSCGLTRLNMTLAWRVSGANCKTVKVRFRENSCYLVFVPQMSPFCHSGNIFYFAHFSGGLCKKEVESSPSRWQDQGQWRKLTVELTCHQLSHACRSWHITQLLSVSSCSSSSFPFKVPVKVLSSPFNFKTLNFVSLRCDSPESWGAVMSLALASVNP